MKCPSCGAPNVILHKDIWECGWCGDSGPIPRRFFAQRNAAHQRQEAWWQEAAATARWAAQTITESAEELLPGRKDAAALNSSLLIPPANAVFLFSGKNAPAS